ncbi:MAG: cytidine deaminase [Chthoniobacterales bacterium]|nr:cytidine deaminase [Chthoniobacterales bacterium]
MDTLSAKDRNLLDAAEAARPKAYAPYSFFHVGAAVRTRKGDVYAGCNVENISYPVGICAERNAIAAAVLAEGSKMEIAAIAVAAYGKDGQSVGITPCGACRQAIMEFGQQARVIFTGNKGELRIESIDKLLPDSFTFQSLT